MDLRGAWWNSKDQGGVKILEDAIMKPWGKHSQSKHSPNLSQGRESWKDPRPYVLILIIPFNIIKGELGRTAGALPLWKIHSFLGGQNLYWSKNEVYWSSIGRVLDVYWTRIIARRSRCIGRKQTCIGLVCTSSWWLSRHAVLAKQWTSKKHFGASLITTTTVQWSS